MIRTITLRNYRGIGSSGAMIPLDHEFIALIGVNNSGKSSILRSMFEMRQVFHALAGQVLSDISFHLVFGPNGNGLGPPKLSSGERIFPSFDGIEEPRMTLTLNQGQYPSSITELTVILRRTGNVSVVCKTQDGLESTGLMSISSVMGDHGQPELEGRNEKGQTVRLNWEPVREDLLWLSSAMYIGPFRNAINSGGADYFDIDIGKDFISRFDNFKNGPNFEANESIQRLCDELARIFHFGKLEINVSPSKDSLVYFVDGKSFRGTELGGGITQFLMVAANVLVKKPTLLLIDEPELNLHASLQRQFLTLLASYSNGGVVFSTHSLGLARSVADRILVVTRGKDGTSRADDYRSGASISSALGELGYGGLNDSAYRAVLLVEGVTDVRVFQELLAKYGIRNEVVIVPLGGDDLAAGKNEIELAELKRLSDRTFAVVDSEQDAPGSGPSKQRNTFRTICEAQNITCHVLERRAIENYLDIEVARRILNASSAKVFGHFEKPGDDWNWRKERNWRIAQEMNRGMLDASDLGPFLMRVANEALQPFDQPSAQESDR